MDLIFVSGLVLIWWTFAVFVFSVVINQLTVDSFQDVFLAVGFSVFWPVTAVLALVGIIYSSVVKSAEVIRADLHNRKLLHEFDRWYKSRSDDN